MVDIQFNVDPQALFALLGKQRDIQERIFMLGWDDEDTMNDTKMGYIGELVEVLPDELADQAAWLKSIEPSIKREIAEQLIDLIAQAKQVAGQLDALKPLI